MWGNRLVAAILTWSLATAVAAGASGPPAANHLVLWLDAQDIDGQAKQGKQAVAGTRLGRWADKSGRGNHALQAVPERRPTCVAGGSKPGLTVVQFDAARRQYLSAPRDASLNVAQLTAFVVARAGECAANMWLLGKNHWGPPWTGYGIAVSKDGLHPWPHLGLGPSVGHSGLVAGSVSSQFAQQIDRDLSIVEVCCDGIRLHMLLNGRADGVRGARGRILENDRELLIGAGPQTTPPCEFLHGEIAEILLYDRALEPGERRQACQYLAAKYGVTLADDGRADMVNRCPPNQVIDNGYLPITVENPTTPETRALTAEEAAGVLRRDWLFQADGQPLAARAVCEVAWARELAARLAKHAKAPSLAEELAELDRLARRLEAAASQALDAPAAEEVYLLVRRVKRRMMLKNPVVDFRQLLFIDQPYPQGPEWRHQAIHRLGHRAVCGGRLLALDGLDPGGRIRQLAPRDKPGSFWRPDLSFDAKNVLFCYKAHDEKAFHLYAMNLDGSGLRQLTAGDYDDLDPIHLPDGHVMFTTTRGNTYVRCGPYIYSTLLARCDADGGNVYLVSQNSEPDFLPSLLGDGRVVYSRWEYTDKSVFRVQSLWTTNPDGTGTTVLWGNQSVWPDHLAQPRPIPGSRRVMFTGVGHHDWFTGSIGIIDPQRGFNYPQGITRVTWDVPWAEVGSPPADRPEAGDYHSSGRYSSYQTPYPLSEADFLVSARAADDKFRLYLMDVHGNRELIYEGAHHVWHAIPVKPRPVPPRIPDRVAWPGTGEHRRRPAMGALYSSDVYQGVPDLPRGSAKYLRVIQSDPKTYSTWFKTFRLSGPPISVVYEESVKRILSEVPVDADGSVSFEVPPGRALHFQLLDEQRRCLQTMRSFAGVMPGEQRGCVGCHESHSAAPAAKSGLPLRRPPSALAPPPWGDESISFERFAQPLLDRYCVKCHQGKSPGSEEPDLRLRPGHGPFKEPYLTLIGPAGWQNPAPAAQHGGGIAGAIPVETTDNTKLDPRALATLRPMKTLSWTSKLVELAAGGKHYGVRADPASLRRLTAWVDANCPYLGDEELRQHPDPEFPGIELLPIRPRVASAPIVERP